jgi:nicotinamidase-related amidase
MDYQVDVVSRYTQRDSGLLDRAAETLNAARAAGIPVIYIAVQFRAGYPEINPRNGTFAALRESGRLLAGSPSAAIQPQVAPQSNEPVVIKRRVGAFSTTDLETILCAQGVTTLVLMGIATSGVVLSTIRWAADMDYNLVVVEDCCADGDEEVHRVLMQKVFPRQARVTSADTLRQALRKITPQ